MVRYLALAVLPATVLLLAACSAGSQPLASATRQKGVELCAEAPNTAPSAGVPAWNSPTGWSIGRYYNTTASPVELQSVALIDSHGLVLHGAVVYEMRHSENAPVMSDGWGKMSLGTDPVLWARRQNLPGAVVPPAASATGTPGTTAPDTYAVVLDISAKTPAGGWAIGQQITYRQGSTQYTIRLYSGYAIRPPAGPDGPDCQAQRNAIEAAWQAVPAATPLPRKPVVPAGLCGRPARPAWHACVHGEPGALHVDRGRGGVSR